ncbi:MAG: N-acetylneuraminic acid mutarotase [Paraglaciecola sp.]|jgi:N-acetylneuraminic acid mutarotase
MFQKFTNVSCQAYLVFLLLFISACSSINMPNSPDKLTLQTARYGHAAATDGKRIYVFAGSNGGTFLTDIEIINPATGNVQVLKDRVIPRRYFSAVWDGEHSIYLIGGISLTEGKARLESRVEIFNLLTQQITFAKPMPEPASNSQAVFLYNSIYVFGGSTSNKLSNYKLAATSTSAMYDTRSNKWRKLADMPTAKSTSAIVKDGVIYVAGGFNHKAALNVFERFDPKGNHWQILPPMPRNISAHSIARMGEKMLLFGDYEKLDSTLMYDFESKTWTEVDLGYQASRHNTSVTIGNTIYVVGGNINSKGESVDVIQQFSL